MFRMVRPSRLLARDFAFVLTLALALPAHARDYQLGALRISNPWTRATPGGARVAAGFMAITNSGAEADRLIGGSVERAAIFEIHEMAIDGGVMRMRARASGLEIRPGETVTLKPGGYHAMFIDIRQRFEAGESVKGELVFEKAGKIAVEFKVEALGASGAAEGGHKH